MRAWGSLTSTCARVAMKRAQEEFEDVSGVVATSPSARIHGIVTSVSPMKKSRTCNYFDGEITDGKTSMRLFGFDSVSGVRKR